MNKNWPNNIIGREANMLSEKSSNQALHTPTVLLDTSMSDNHHDNRLPLQKYHQQNTQAKHSNSHSVQ